MQCRDSFSLKKPKNFNQLKAFLASKGEFGQNWGNYEAVRHNDGSNWKKGTALHRRPPDWRDGAVIAQLTGAIARAFLVVLLIATPSLMLPDVSRDSTQIVALVAIFAAGLTLFEYTSKYPGLVEFRAAPPFNRIRFGSMMITVFLLTIICLGQTESTPLTRFVSAVGGLIGSVIDFPYSPVRLVVLMLPDDATPAHVALVRSVAGMAYLISLVSLAIFILLIRVNRWPARNGAFNVWINLPTFDPTAGGDVVDRLARDARFNVAMGFLLPFLIPAVAKAASVAFGAVSLDNYQTLIWTTSAWALLPASLFMRGIAIGRIADMIRDQRRRSAHVEEEAEFVPA